MREGIVKQAPCTSCACLCKTVMLKRALEMILGAAGAHAVACPFVTDNSQNRENRIPSGRN
jgi:hypothetical protein